MPLLKQPSVDTLKRNAIRSTAVNIIQLAEKEYCDSLGKLIIYSGKDSARYFTEILDLSDENEKYMAESACEALKIWLSNSQKYEFGAYEISNRTADDSLYSQEIIFISDETIEKVNFVFTAHNDKFYLVNLD